MSYDFRLFPRRTGEDPLVTAQRDADEEDMEIFLPDAEKEALKLKVASALMAFNPDLQPFQFEYDEITKMQGISIEEAKLKYRHIELNGPDKGNGIQIDIYDDEISLTVPFWHTAEKASTVFREIWGYLKIIQSESGYITYDLQLDSIVDLNVDFQRVLNVYEESYQSMMRQLPDTIKEMEPKRPWWQFWKN